MSIQFFSEETAFTLDSQDIISNWIVEVASLQNYQVGDLNYIFCSDDYLLEINKEHLNHDYYTDIITFDQSEEDGLIEADIFISVDRVKDNAEKLGVDFPKELYRVIIHGLLHLLGFGDKTEAEKTEMREKEDACISLLKV